MTDSLTDSVEPIAPPTSVDRSHERTDGRTNGDGGYERGNLMSGNAHAGMSLCTCGHHAVDHILSGTCDVSRGGKRVDDCPVFTPMPEAGPYCTCGSRDGLHALACRINR